MTAERLRQIRQARGLSLDDLAHAAGRIVTKQAISKYENGLDTPSARVQIALAHGLGVPPGALAEKPGLSTTTLFYRLRASLGSREQERLESYLSFRLEQHVRVRDLLEPGAAVDLPVRSMKVADEGGAEAAATAMRQTWGIGRDAIANVVDLLEGRGVAVCITDADAKFDGLSAVASGEGGRVVGAAVLCRSGLTRERQRLNLAHELGHVVLDPSDNAQEEGMAWRFAGALLAPADAILSDVGARRQQISLNEMLILKQRYGLSMQALYMRFKALGILSQESLRRAFVEISRHGWKQHEPGDTVMAEEPQVFRSMVLRAVSERLMTTATATDLLGEPVEAAPRSVSFARILASRPLAEREEVLAAMAADGGTETGYDSDWIDLDEANEH